MIYLIGAPPRCGKTTLAKKMSKQTKIPWLSSDTLDAITQEYTPAKNWKKKFPYSYLRRKVKTRNNDYFYNTYSPTKIVSVLKQESKTVHKAIETVIACEIADRNNYIIEGYHILPSFAQNMIKKFGKNKVRAVFLTKLDENKFVEDVQKSTTPNDWLIVLTKKQGTFVKVGKMVSTYSKDFEREAKKFGLKVFNTDINFNGQINSAIKYLIG